VSNKFPATTPNVIKNISQGSERLYWLNNLLNIVDSFDLISGKASIISFILSSNAALPTDKPPSNSSLSFLLKYL
jgi:hypothetical protein